MSFLKHYKNFEKEIYIAKNNKDFNEKYDNIKKIKINIFSRSFKFFSLVGTENLANFGMSFTFKVNKRFLIKNGPLKNKKDFEKAFPNITCSIDDIKKPKFIKYIWNKKKFSGITLFVDKDIPQVINCKSKYKIAILNESRYVNPKIYSIIHDYEKYFDLILTHNKEIIDKYMNKAFFIPASSGTLNWNEMKIYKKTKLVSFIASCKLSGLEGYNLRNEIKDYINSNNFIRKKIDTFGSGFNNTFTRKIVCSKDYMFSICIENMKYDYYLTEKIIDIILSGCIPIYWGMPSIGDIFDSRGIITFNNMDELKNIINDLNEDKYYEMLPYVEKNFNIVKKFIDWDDNNIKSAYDLLEI